MDNLIDRVKCPRCGAMGRIRYTAYHSAKTEGRLDYLDGSGYFDVANTSLEHEFGEPEEELFSCMVCGEEIACSPNGLLGFVQRGESE